MKQDDHQGVKKRSKLSQNTVGNVFKYVTSGISQMQVFLVV